MEEFIEERFSSTAVGERKRIVNTLSQLGVDSVEDLPLLEESDLTGKIKPIHARKLLQIAKEGKSCDLECYPYLTLSAPTDVAFIGVALEQAQQSLDDIGTVTSDLESPTTRNETKSRLALATGILGGATAIAAPLAVFAVLFPPITAPIAVAVGATATVLGAATAGTGIAGAVIAHKDKNEKRRNEENSIVFEYEEKQDLDKEKLLKD